MAAKIDLGGTAALVTGASRGLGRAMALALAEAGADLALTARSVDDLERTASEVRKHGVRAEVLPADVQRPREIEEVVERTIKAYGRIDVLVNNAGISGADKLFLDLALDEWEEVVAVDLRAPALYAQAVARRMAEQRRGSIINVASIMGLQATSRLAPYCASKAGLIQLTRVLALELARYSIRVNALCPGYFRTPMNEAFFGSPKGQELIERAIPMRRLGDPGELVPAVVFLASDASSFMTGSVMVIDGGQTLT